MDAQTGKMSKEVPAELFEDDSIDNSPPEPVSADEIISGAPYEHRGASASLDVVTTGVADPNSIPTRPMLVRLRCRSKSSRK